MSNKVDLQLSLRRAFRVTCLLFLAMFAALLVLFSLSVLNGDVGVDLDQVLPYGSLPLIIAFVIGFSVPLFAMAWSLVGTVLLGRGMQRRSLLEGITD